MLIAVAVIILVCIFLNNFSTKAGVPVLLLFILFGMLYGWLELPEYLDVVEQICTTALIFIMFYGGFGTSWKTAKPVATHSGILATVGVFLTAALTGLFCCFVLGWNWKESMLLGAVVSSTDAATVFSILRNRKMGLKENSGPMLEIESGSNDPCSYMLTIIMLSVISGTSSGLGILYDIFAQFVYGIGIGVTIALLAAHVLKRRTFQKGFDSMYMVSIALAAYAIPSLIGGNGYLSVYIVGIILGNTDFNGKKSLVGFFDGLTSFMQILIFFILGYIAIPSSLYSAIVPAILIFLFMTIVARPATVFSLLMPAKKYSKPFLKLVSFVGLRGAASIVFAIMTITSGAELENDIFSVVFCIVLISIGLQGSLIPYVSKKLNMVDTSNDIMGTFSDYTENEEITFGTVSVKKNSVIDGQLIKNVKFPQGLIVTFIERNKQYFVPNGDTVVEAGDNLVFCTRSFDYEIMGRLVERPLAKGSKWAGKALKEYPSEENTILIMIKRGNERIIPNGETIMQEGDILVIVR